MALETYPGEVRSHLASIGTLKATLNIPSKSGKVHSRF